MQLPPTYPPKAEDMLYSALNNSVTTTRHHEQHAAKILNLLPISYITQYIATSSPDSISTISFKDLGADGVQKSKLS